MHPVLADRRLLALYLATFLLGGGAVAELLVRSTGLVRAEALTIALPTALLHAFGCLASWYPARTLPPLGAPTARAVVGAAGATAVAALVAVGGAELLARGLAGAGAADLEARWVGGPILVGLVAGLAFVAALAFHAALHAIDVSRRAEARAWESRSLAREAELRALRAQVDPHFLFNSLNAIAGLVVAEPRQARAMCVALANFLRRSLRRGAAPVIPLADELALLDDYLAVEAIRLGERLRVERDIDPSAAQVSVPPLLLQPLVENAVRHGIAARLDGGVLGIRVGRNAGRIVVSIENDSAPAGERSAGDGIGLENVRRRSRAAWGGAAKLRVRDAGDSFRVELDFPAPDREDAA